MKTEPTFALFRTLSNYHSQKIQKMFKSKNYVKNYHFLQIVSKIYIVFLRILVIGNEAK